MKLKNLFILQMGVDCILRLKCSDCAFSEDYYVIDNELFFMRVQQDFGDIEISKVDVLKNVYFTVVLDRKLFVEFRNYLSNRRF